MKYILIILTVVTNIMLATVSIASEPKQPLSEQPLDDEQPLEEMVAVVNEDLITQSELANALKTVKIQLASQKMREPSDKILRKQVLDQLINKKLQLQTAKQAGLTTTDEELDQAIEKIASQNNVSAEELYQRIEHEGIAKAKYRADIREQITMQKLQQREIAGKVTVTPEEISNFITSAKAKMTNENEYLIHDILIPISDKPSKKELARAEKRAEKILQTLRDGSKISSIIKQYKKRKLDVQDGDLGWRSKGEIPTAFAKSVFSMKKSQYSAPIKAGNGFHILFMKDVRQIEASDAQFADKKKIETLLLQRKFEQAVQNWVSKLRSQAFITIT